jgi:hypothetical protein
MDPVNKRALALIVGIAAVAVAGFYLDHAFPLGIETSGVVTGSTTVTDENGNSWKMISVKLSDGSVVEAKAPPACVVFPGDPAHLRGIRTMYSVSRTYMYLGQRGEDET